MPLYKDVNGLLPCADQATQINLCSLPPDCLQLILSKIEFGDSKRKQAAWALAGTCRTVRQAVTACPAAVKLQGGWSRRQMLGAECHCVSCALSFSSLSALTFCKSRHWAPAAFAVLWKRLCQSCRAQPETRFSCHNCLGFPTWRYLILIIESPPP